MKWVNTADQTILIISCTTAPPNTMRMRIFANNLIPSRINFWEKKLWIPKMTINRELSWETESPWKVIETGMIMKKAALGTTNSRLNSIFEKSLATVNNFPSLSPFTNQISSNPRACMITPSSKTSTWTTFWTTRRKNRGQSMNLLGKNVSHLPRLWRNRTRRLKSRNVLFQGMCWKYRNCRRSWRSRKIKTMNLIKGTTNIWES